MFSGHLLRHLFSLSQQSPETSPVLVFLSAAASTAIRKCKEHRHAAQEKNGPSTPRNPVARNAGKFNKAATHSDRKKELKKTGPTPEQQQDAAD